jgi:hypothetical protein
MHEIGVMNLNMQKDSYLSADRKKIWVYSTTGLDSWNSVSNLKHWANAEPDLKGIGEKIKKVYPNLNKIHKVKLIEKEFNLQPS